MATIVDRMSIKLQMTKFVSLQIYCEGLKATQVKSRYKQSCADI